MSDTPLHAVHFTSVDREPARAGQPQKVSSGAERRVVASRLVRALLVTPDEDCASTTANIAARSRWFRIDLTRVDSVAELRSALAYQEYDVVLIDTLATAGVESDPVSELRQRESSPPVILLKAGANDDIKDRRRGAADCLPKAGLSATTLESSILYVLQRRQTETVLNAAERVKATLQTKEAEVKALLSQLCQVQKTDALGRVAGGIIHDFNNVLGAIDGYAELLALSLDAEDQRRTDLEEIRGAAVRGRDLTRQLLSFVRRQPQTATLTDLNTAVTSVTQMLRRLMPDRIELATRCDAALAGIKMDRTRCEQLVLNLVINARDAIAGNGRIAVETSNVLEEPGAIAKSQGAEQRRFVKLTVSDNGVGMDEHTQARIFDPLFTTKGEAGTGLGLAVVKSVVREGGGQVRVSSKVGHGTTFTVLFPASEEEVGNAAGKKEGVASNSPAVILLVEDRASLRDAYARMLRHYGYTVLEARDGLDALQVHRESHVEVDVLITDLRMPRLGGRELANALRFVRPSMQVLFTSGYPPTALANGNAMNPSAEFLEKPFTAEQLVCAVRSLLQRRALKSIPAV